MLPSFAAASDLIPNRYVVVFKDEVGDVVGTTQRLVSTHGGVLRHQYQYALHGFAGDFSPSAIEALGRDPAVAYLQQDQVVRITDTQLNPPSWGLDRVDQRNLPLDNSYTYNNAGTGAHVYIIDTGIRITHVTFTGRASFDFNSVGDGINTDCNGHGTHVAGTAGGVEYGIAKDVTLHAVKVLDCGGSGSFSGVIAGVDFVTANHIDPAVANMSLGGGFFQALNDAVTNSVNAGVVYSISAGNENQNACNVSPASTPLAITVASEGITDARSFFSNWGTCVDIFAPGENIVSAYNTSDIATATLSGTSMSAPHVTGAAALYRVANPGATPADVASALTSNATMNVITNPGTGTPNRLLYTAFIGGGGGNLPPVANFTFSCTGLTCNFNGSSSTDDGTIVSYSWNFGDGTTGTGVSPSKTYAAGGTYNVTLTVTDDGGLTDDATQAVTVSGGGTNPPVANFTFTCTGLTCSFDASSSQITNRPIQSATWNFGDGTTGTGGRPTKTYAAAGTYNVTFTIVDALGQSDSETKAVTVSGGGTNPPVANFTFTCTGLTCSFDASSSQITNRPIQSATWNFGDGTTGTGGRPTKTYAAAGTYNVTFTIVDALGQSDSETKAVMVQSAAAAPAGR
jgi:PKD repeat protein